MTPPTDEERALAREIVGTCEFPAVPCVFTSRPASLCTRCGILPDVAAALAEARREGRREGIEEAAKACDRPCTKGCACCCDCATQVRALATPAQEEKPKTEIPNWFWGSLR